MAKISEEVLASQLVTEKLIKQSEVWDFVDRCKKAEEETKEPKEDKQKLSTDYVIIVDGSKFTLPDNLTGWIIKKVPDSTVHEELPEDESAPGKVTCGWGDLEVEEKLEKWGRSVATSKGMTQSTSMAGVIYKCSKKQAKEVGLDIKTKSPVAILAVNPDLPYLKDKGTEISNNINFIR